MKESESGRKMRKSEGKTEELKKKKKKKGRKKKNKI